MQFETLFFNKIPCTMTKKGYREVTPSTFWAQAEKRFPGISNAKGCYIFGLATSGGGLRPYYVGQATKTFIQEVFAVRKREHYHGCINDKYGTPVLILIPAVTQTGQYVKGKKDRLIDWVETLLIGYALAKNPNLLNRQKTKNLSEAIIPGLLNTPQGKNNTKDSKALKKMLFGETQK
ncbi:MAG: hypothetical protein LBC70_00430 [Chitinispirillales bacterium]|jgi:hypothetical protein|nr:hypothetical protein [Chitinispirillales bacterium]